MEEIDKLTPAGRRVLASAAELFYRQGIHAVGVDAIAAASGVTKRTLYACFGSKDGLVTAYLTERDQRWRAWLTERIDRVEPPREKITAVFDALETWIDAEEFRGCGFTNALAELPSPDHPARRVILEQRRWMSELLTELLRTAGATDPSTLATTVLLLFEGGIIARAKGLEGAIRHARGTVASLLPDRPA